jgi:hydrogenase maturation protease
MRDDGIGARVLDDLDRRYALPSTVRLISSGAPMARLLAEVDGIEHLIVVDAVRSGRAPGTIHRLKPDQLEVTGHGACSSHGVGLADFFALLTTLGRCPEIRIIGVEAGELDKVGSELSPPVAAALPRAVDAVMEELRRLGVRLDAREAAHRHA